MNGDTIENVVKVWRKALDGPGDQTVLEALQGALEPIPEPEGYSVASDPDSVILTLSGNRLFTVLGDGQATAFRVRSCRLPAAPIERENTGERDTFPEPSEKRQGPIGAVVWRWTFDLAPEPRYVVTGLVSDDGDFDGAERFARLLAGRLGWQGLSSD